MRFLARENYGDFVSANIVNGLMHVIINNKGEFKIYQTTNQCGTAYIILDNNY
jgi:hypothetical protein